MRHPCWRPKPRESDLEAIYERIGYRRIGSAHRYALG